MRREIRDFIRSQHSERGDGASFDSICIVRLGIKWDGFVYAVGTGTSDKFRYASIIHGGPGALINDGDDEINGVLGLDVNFRPPSVPDSGSSWTLAAIALVGLCCFERGRTARDQTSP
jgi:hypothetical protein